MRKSVLTTRPTSKVDRRSFLRAAGGTVAFVGVSSFEGSAAATRGKWDLEADVIVVGSGAAALTGAVAAAAKGAKVVVLESAPVAGGATARSGGGYWIPNNRHMRARGQTDTREDALRYMARYSFTQLFDPDALHYGIPQNSYELMEAMYDNAAPAIEHLEQLGALQTRGDQSYDYWDYAPENKAAYGRLIWTKFEDDQNAPGKLHPATAVTPEWHSLDIWTTPPRPGRGDAGAEFIRQLSAWLEKNNVPILLEHRVTRLITNRRQEVIGVEATTTDSTGHGQIVAIRARKAVHFGSGGFTQNEELRLAFQRGPVFGSCGPVTNQGDLVYMSTGLGAKLGNMQNGWHFQLVLDQAIQTPALATDVWGLPGDSMFVVNKFGKRVVNEKRPYSDRAEVHYVYDPSHEEWTNLVLFKIFDQRVVKLCAGQYPHPEKGGVAPYIIQAETLDGLSAGIAQRLARFARHTGGFKLDESFTNNLRDTFVRFNGFANSGVDEDFNRGKYRYDLQWHERFGGDESVGANDRANKTMYPLSDHGPYFAILLVKGQADTNGGPVINSKAQIVSVRNEPIPGLYGAGNCIAAPSGRAYWGGGATLGPAITFGYIAGKNAAQEPVKQEA